MAVQRDAILDSLKSVLVPGGGDLVSRDLVRAIQVEGGDVRFVGTLTGTEFGSLPYERQDEGAFESTPFPLSFWTRLSNSNAPEIDGTDSNAVA